MEFWIPFLLIALPILLIMGPKIWATWRSIKHANDGSDRKVPLGTEAIDIEGFNDAVRQNEAIADKTGVHSRQHSHMSASRGPLRMGKTGDAYSKNYHKLFGSKSK